MSSAQWPGAPSLTNALNIARKLDFTQSVTPPCGEYLTSKKLHRGNHCEVLTAADGADGFKDLITIVDELEHVGAVKDWCEQATISC